MGKRKKKILFVAHENGLGGATRALIEIINYFNAKDIEVIVVVPCDRGELSETFQKNNNLTFIYKKYYFWNIPYRNVIRCIFQNIAMRMNIIKAYQVRRILKKYHMQVDCVYTNTSITDFGVLLSKVLKVPHIWHFREMPFPEYMKRRYVVYSKQISNRIEKTNKIICSSNSIKEEFKKRYGGSHYEVIYDGISPDCIQKHQYNLEKNRDFKLLITGNISEQKGQSEAIRTLGLLHIHGYTNVHLIIAGSGDDSIIKAEIEKNNVQGFVDLKGQVDNMLDLRKDVDIELVCSMGEGFGRVTVEAMLAGLPVIGTNRGATKEIICDGKTGYLYEKGDVNKLFHYIEKLINNPLLIEKMGRNGQKEAMSKYLLNNQMKKIWDTVENCI